MAHDTSTGSSTTEDSGGEMMSADLTGPYIGPSAWWGSPLVSRSATIAAGLPAVGELRYAELLLRLLSSLFDPVFACLSDTIRWIGFSLYGDTIDKQGSKCRPRILNCAIRVRLFKIVWKEMYCQMEFWKMWIYDFKMCSNVNIWDKSLWWQNISIIEERLIFFFFLEVRCNWEIIIKMIICRLKWFVLTKLLLE